MSDRRPALLIANPAAGWRPSAVLPRLVAALTALNVPHRVAVTRGRGHAEALARDATVDDDVELVVAVGGDGTLHEVVNGLVDAVSGRPHGARPVLGVVTAGSGSDFARTFGLDRSPERLARHLAGAATVPLDLGRVRLTGPDGRERVRLFANVAEAGFGAVVARRAQRLPRRLGRSRYVVAAVAGAGRLRCAPVTVAVEHITVEEPLSNVVVANGQFFGGGLKVAPRALPDDGRFNVQLWRGRPRDVILLLPAVRVGDHVASAAVREYQSATVRVTAPAPLLVEADGEVLGTTPAAFDVLPQVVRLRL